jgi:phosphoglycerate dehydrogenase-like enzyme
MWVTVILLGAQPEAIKAQDRDRIHELAPGTELLVTEDHDEIEAALQSIEIAARRFPHDLIPRASSLRWMQQWGAGTDWLMRYPQVAQVDFVLTNASGVHAIPISEHILSLLLALGRQLDLAVRAQVRREWRQPQGMSGDPGRPIFELAGKTMLLIGVGAIGARTAEIAAALGMRVWGIRRDPAIAVPHVHVMHGPQRLPDLLPEADFVVLTVPLTHETRGLIGEVELRAMKPSAYIVNIGRGGTIQQPALVRALREKWIAGAGLDVFEREPLPCESPLWDMENVIITAHYSGRTPHYEERAMAIFLDNLKRYVEGRPLRNTVDKSAGY